MALITWAVGASSRFSLLRIIPCAARETGSRIPVKLLEFIIKVILTVSYVQLLSQTKLETKVFKPNYTLNFFGMPIIVYGCFSRLYHDPLFAAVSSIVLVFRADFVWLIGANFVLNRGMILGRKATYILVSFITAVKNKKQRFSF